MPCLLIVRDPVDAVVSHLVRQPRITPRQALCNWTMFHERVMPIRDQVVVADFCEVTTDFGAVIAAVNARFGTRFDQFDHTDDMVQKVFWIIEARHRERYGTIREDLVARPSPARRERQLRVRAGVVSPATAGARERAYEAYEELKRSPPEGDRHRPRQHLSRQEFAGDDRPERRQPLRSIRRGA